MKDGNTRPKRPGWWSWGIALVLYCPYAACRLVAVLFLPIGKTANGAANWLLDLIEALTERDDDG